MPPKSVFTWPSYFTRMNDVDPDHRQMALFDLSRFLQSTECPSLLPDEDKVVETIKKCFGPSEHNSEVHSHSVKILPLLFSKLQSRSRDGVLALLAKNVWDTIPTATKEDLPAIRDNASMALKTLTDAIPDTQRENMIIMTASLLPGLKSAEAKIRCEVDEVFIEVIRRFGTFLPAAHLEEIQRVSVQDLNGDTNLRKRAAALLATVCMFTVDAKFAEVVEITVQGLSRETGDRLRRYILLCTSIARAAGARFAGSVQRVIPLLLKELGRLNGLDDEAKESHEANETREQILQAFECFVMRCPNFVTGLLPEMLAASASLIKWDPNYCDDGDAGDFDLEEDADDADAGLDDDDSSWKVRKAAARLVKQTLLTHGNALRLVVDQFFNLSNPLLVSRLNERIETVRLEIFEILRRVVELSCVVSDAPPVQDALGDFVGGSFRVATDIRPEANSLVQLQDQLVRTLIHSANHKSQKIKIASIAMLHDLFMLLGNSLNNSLGECVKLVLEHLVNPKFAHPHLRPDVLRLCRCLVVVARRDSATAVIVEPLLAPACKCMEDRFFKTVVAAVKVGLEFVALLRTSKDADASTLLLFRALSARLSAVDADLETKKSAMEAMAVLIRYHDARLRKIAGAELNQSFEALLRLLQSDATRVAAARAFAHVCRGEMTPQLVADVARELTLLLHRADRAVREAALRTLIAIMPAHGKALDGTVLRGIALELVNEATQLLSDKELFVAALSLQLCASIARVPGQAVMLKEVVSARAIQLVATPFAQGALIREASELFRLMAARGDVAASDLLDPLLAAGQSVNASSVGGVACLVGAVIGADRADAKRQLRYVDQLVTLARSTSNVQHAALGLACLGEVGRNVNLDSITPKATETLRAALGATAEEVKVFAAIAIGRAAASESGASIFAGILRDLAAGRPEQRYSTLRALREALTAAVGDAHGSAQAIPEGIRDPVARGGLIQQLFAAADAVKDDETQGDIPAECLGRIAQLEPSDSVAAIAAVVLQSGSSEARVAAGLGALRCGLSGSTSLQSSRGPLDDVLKLHVLKCVSARLHRDQPLRVRRQALHCLLSAVYSRPVFLLTDAAARTTTLANWLSELEVDKRFVTEVDLGPFKHKVDKSLEVRKLAFEVFATLAESLSRPPSILELHGQYGAVAAGLVGGLSDPDPDIIQSATNTIVKFARFHGGATEVANLAPRVFDALKVTAMAKDPQEPERAAEASKLAIATAFRLTIIVPEVSRHPKFIELCEATKVLPHFDAARRSATAESAAANVAS